MTKGERIDTGIYKIGNSFKFTVALGMDINGKQIRKTSTYKPPKGITEKQAIKMAKQKRLEFEQYCQGTTNLKESMRFSELAEWYFENYANLRLKEITAYTYKHQVDYHLIGYFGNKKLKDINPVMITEFFRECTDGDKSYLIQHRKNYIQFYKA
jgi:integrase